MRPAGARPWIAYDKDGYPIDEPSIYDTSGCPWVPYVESHWMEIREELVRAIERQEETLLPYPDPEKTNRPKAWRTAGLMYWTFASDRYARVFPRTWEILSKIPHLTSASLLLLEPNSTIKPHVGDTNAMFRCHLGLIVPAPAPRCGFRVRDVVLSWEEGKIFMFNDAHEHTAWNNTPEPRYILSFDVMRPEFRGMERWVATSVLGNIYLDVVSQRNAAVRQLRRLPGGEPVLRKMSQALFYVLSVTGRPLYNLL